MKALRSVTVFTQTPVSTGQDDNAWRQLPVPVTFATTETSTFLQSWADLASNTLLVFGGLTERFPTYLIDAMNVPGLRFICPDIGTTQALVQAHEHLYSPFASSLAYKIGEYFDNPNSTTVADTQDFAAARSQWQRLHGEVQSVSLAAVNSRSSSGLHERTETPLVDVCIPYFNDGKYLAQLMLSLERQNIDDFSVTVVNDGSTDSYSLEVFERLAVRYASRGWRFISQPNSYPGAARNAGARLGHAPYICFVDADDVAAPNMVERFLTGIEQTGSDSLGCYFQLFDGDGFPNELDTSDPAQPLTEIMSFVGGGLTATMRYNVLGGGCFIVKRSVFETLEGFTEGRYLPLEDHEFFTRLVLKGYDYDVMPECLLYYRQTQQSLTHAVTDSMQFLGHLRVLDAFARQLQPLGLGDIPRMVLGLTQQIDTPHYVKDRQENADLQARIAQYDEWNQQDQQEKADLQARIAQYDEWNQQDQQEKADLQARIAQYDEWNQQDQQEKADLRARVAQYDEWNQQDQQEKADLRARVAQYGEPDQSQAAALLDDTKQASENQSTADVATSPSVPEV